MSLSLLLLPSIHASESYIALPAQSVEQAIAVVQAYGIANLDDAYVSARHNNVTEGNPYEVVLNFGELRDRCGMLPEGCKSTADY